MEGRRREVDEKELEQSSQKEMDPKAMDQISTIEMKTFLSPSPLPSFEARLNLRFGLGFAWSRQWLYMLRQPVERSRF